MMKDSGIEWVGDIPESWSVSPAGGLFAEVKEKNKNLKYTNPLQFKFGEIVDKAYVGEMDENMLDTISTYTCVEPDTIMLNGLNLNYDFVTQRVAIVTKPGVITSAYLAVYPDKNLVMPRFANYLLKAYDSIFVLHGMGSGVRKTLQWKDFKNLKFVLPSIEAQSAIITELDSLCGKADALIANVQAQIEKLKAYKQSLITEVVTKGLDPTVPMKDSGVEWIGEIPERWTVIRFKQVMHKEKKICDQYRNQNIISLTMNGVIIRDLENPVGKMPTTFDGYQYVEDGDLLLCLFDIDVTPRCVGIVRNNGLTSPAYSRFKVHDGFDINYYDYLLRSIDDQKIFVHLAKNLRSSLSESDFGAIPTIFPPISEQQAIVTFLDTKCAQVDHLIAIKQEKLEKLEQYKRSLIYEYVTGKKEVCNEL